MKTSFNFEKYRGDLANELKKERKVNPEETRKKLEMGSKTPEYQIARAFKLLRKKVEEYPSEIQKKENFSFTVEEYDISEQIPHVLKLCADRRRIQVIEHKLSTSVTNKKKYGLGEPDVDVGNKNLKDQLIEYLERKGEVLTNKKTSNFHYFEPLLANKVVNELTNGALLDESTINHVVYGFYDREVFDERLGKFVNSLDKHFEEIKHELNFNPYENIQPLPSFGELRDKSVRLFFQEGGRETNFLKSDSVILIINPRSERFLQAARKAYSNERMNIEYINKLIEEEKKEWLKSKEKAPYYAPPMGIEIGIDTTKTRWIDIADYIVDLNGSKLYKINEEK